ncbi:MAG TPA: hypothetical protein VNG71_13940 [Pyrinomonadaceae bacterium]|nr:hypothetical protein [Pyrinomonadaceae bacterium]
MRKFIAVGVGIFLGLYASEVFGQSCYSQAYGQAQAEPFSLSAQTQTVEVPVRVTVTIPQVQVAAPAPVAVEAPAPCQQSFAAPAPMCGAVGYAPVAVPFVQYHPVGIPFATTYSGHFTRVSGARQHALYLRTMGAIAGGSNIVARDRKGTAVNANFVNNVRIKRNFFGNIKEVTTDQPRGGLLSRLNPF